MDNQITKGERMKIIHKIFLASMLLLVLTLILSACKKQESIANFEAQKYTIDERQGVPLTTITAGEDANAEKELTLEEKAALWQKKQEEEAKYRQWKDIRDNERQQKEEEERIENEIKFFNNSR